MKIVQILFVMILCFQIGIEAQVDTIAPNIPQGVQAFGYEKNVDVEW